MSSHANCTHEKTKAARAACRAGKAPADMPSRPAKAQPERLPGEKKAEARSRLHDIASRSAHKFGEAKDEGEPSGLSYRTEDGFIRGGNISGTCGIGAHDRCRGGGKQWYCTCDCHGTNHAE